MKRETLRGIVLWSQAVAFGILFLWLFGKYLFVGILPFAIAYPLSLLIRPAASFFAKKAGLQRNFCCVVIIVIILTLAVLLITWLVSTLISETHGLITSLISALEKEDNLIRRGIDYFEDMKNKIPFLTSENNDTMNSLYTTLMNTLSSTLSQLTNSVADAASCVIKKLPKFFLALITTVIALFYFSMDKGGLRASVKRVFGDRITNKLLFIKSKAIKAFTSYTRSYMIIMLITFSELFLGFVILRIDYAVLLALFIAAIDLLPVLGSGAVIVPFGFLQIAAGDIRTGAGLFILGGIMYIVRQITEPHILGSVMGIHPIISLFTVYVGFILFGFCGILFLPILTYLIKAVFFGEDVSTSKSL